jgi:membrane protease subunit HflC
MSVGYNALFAVYQSRRALVVRLCQLCKSLSSPSPGLSFKIPFIDRVIAIEKRILDREMPAQEVIASDQKCSRRWNIAVGASAIEQSGLRKRSGATR